MNNKRPKIAILGAGPMGLGVAYELCKHGVTPVVFEADDRIGGMTASMKFGDVEIERFYHFHCTSDFDFLQILDELGLSEEVQWKNTKMGFWVDGHLQPWGSPLALLKFKGMSVVEKFRYGLFAFYCTKIKNWKKLERQSAISWITKWVGQSTYQKLWSSLFDLKFYEMSADLSAPWIWARIRRIGQSRDQLFREKLGALSGGSSMLLGALEANLRKAGCDIRLNSPVTSVTHSTVNELKVNCDSKSEQFDAVISTMPLPLVPDIFKSLRRETLSKYSSLKNVGVVCVILNLKKQVSENFWLNINDELMDIPGLVEYTNLRPMGDAHIVYAPYYMPIINAKFSDSDETFIEKTKHYIRTINPEIEEEDFVDAKASRYRFAQPVCGPGFLDMLPPAETEVPGLWIADTSHYYPEDRGISESLGFGKTLARRSLATLDYIDVETCQK